MDKRLPGKGVQSFIVKSAEKGEKKWLSSVVQNFLEKSARKAEKAEEAKAPAKRKTSNVHQFFALKLKLLFCGLLALFWFKVNGFLFPKDLTININILALVIIFDCRQQPFRVYPKANQSGKTDC